MIIFECHFVAKFFRVYGETLKNFIFRAEKWEQNQWRFEVEVFGQGFMRFNNLTVLIYVSKEALLHREAGDKQVFVENLK